MENSDEMEEYGCSILRLCSECTLNALWMWFEYLNVLWVFSQNCNNMRKGRDIIGNRECLHLQFSTRKRYWIMIWNWDLGCLQSFCSHQEQTNRMIQEIGRRKECVKSECIKFSRIHKQSGIPLNLINSTGFKRD